MKFFPKRTDGTKGEKKRMLTYRKLWNRSQDGLPSASLSGVERREVESNVEKLQLKGRRRPDILSRSSLRARGSDSPAERTA
jgi:hypothetical protein